jgi:fatty acid desaturase
MQASIAPRLSREQGQAVWSSVQEDIDAQALADTAATPSMIRLALLVAAISAALAIAWSPTSSAWMLGCAYLALALLLAQCAFIGHNAGHGSVSRRDGLNRGLGQLSMTLLTGLAFDEWIARHRMHHRFCQDEDRDPDLMVDLVVSLTEKSRQRKGPLGRLLTRHQTRHIWLLSLLFGHSQRHLSQLAALRDVRHHRLDAAMLLLHFTFWFGLPCLMLDVPLRLALLAYFIPLTILGPYLAAIFWVNHMGMPLVEDVAAFSFLEHQSMTSRTIVNAPRWNWLFGGLNFQIEHHLFPRVPSHRLAAVQVIVRGHFERHGIFYNGVSWRAAVGAIQSHLRKIAHAA